MTFHSIGALLALAIAVSFAPPVPAQQQPAGQVAPQAFNVRDADIRAFIADVARATGSTFIVDPSVQGTVNFSNDAPMNESELLGVLLTILRSNGLVAVPAGRNPYRLVPADHAAPQERGTCGMANSVNPLTKGRARIAAEQKKPL